MKRNSLLHLKLNYAYAVSCLFLAILLFPCSHSLAQNVKPLGQGINNTVFCGCTDSTGNLYVVTRNESTDSTVVYKWTLGSQSWQEYGRPNETIQSSQGQFAECFFYNNRFHLSSVSNPDSFFQQVYEYNGSTWNFRGQISRFNHSIKTAVFNNRVYFSGGDSSFTGQGRQVSAYNGLGFSTVGFPMSYMVKGLWPSEMDVSNDTLFMTFHNQLLFHKAPSLWGTYYTHHTSLNSVAVVNKQVYAADVSGRILQLASGGVLDTFSTGFKNVRLKAFKNRLFLTHSKSDLNKAARFAEYSNHALKYYFHNTYPEDIRMTTLVSNAGKNLFYISKNGFAFGGTELRHTGEVRVDSLKVLGFDSIRLKIFKDLNRNFQLDTPGDATGIFNVYEKSNQTLRQTDINGQFTFYPLENEDYYFVYAGEGQQSQDSCFMPPFTGAIGSEAYNSKLTKDTILLPLWRKTSAKRNLALRSWASARARLLDTVILNLEIFNRDCDQSKSNVTVNLTLDPNTTYISSSPSHSSKTGNVITYTLTDLPATEKNRIRVKILYPHTQYSAGQKVRHKARLIPAFQEDSLDNTDSIVQTLVYSYDPNAKHCIPEGYVTKGLRSIRFHIDFQNMGNDDARRVIVVDTLNLQLPVLEFQMVAASHHYGVPTLKGDVVTWTFENINLKPKSFNEAASKGFIIFDAKIDGELKQGDSITNKASIYFDYNSPIETNHSVVIRDDNRNPIEPIHKPYTMIVYPNPAHDYLTVDISYIGSRDITIYDMKGSRVHSMTLDDKLEGRVHTAGWARGIYMVVSDSGESVKVVIE